MALPNQFANVTEATGQQLDDNFNTVGRLAPLGCAITGTNTLTLTLNPNQPTVPSYANYMQFTGIASATNTGAVTAAVGALAQLPVYKDGPAGPVALSGREIIQNCEITLLYDSALNSGNGGFHLYSMAMAALRETQVSLAGLQIGGSTTLAAILSTTAAVTLGALLPQASSTATVNLTGCVAGDAVQVVPPSISVGLVYQGYVLGAGSIAIIATNPSTGTITPVAGSHRVAAQRFAP